MSKRILILLLIISIAILTFCTKKSTSPEEQLLPPTNLTISLVENNKIQLNWEDNSTNETKFIIDRKRGAFNWFDNYSEVLANIISFKDNISTNSDTIYSYRVRAFNEEEYSAYTDTVAWISENAKPSNLEIIQLVQDSLKLTWQDNSIGEQYFRIDRKIGNLNWTENYTKVDGNLTEFIDNNTALFDTCYYKIFAVSGISNSDYSENSFVPFLPAPSNLDLQALGATEVTLTWKDNCHNEEGYRLFIKRGETAVWDSLNLTENTETYSDENVIPGIMNYYKICAYYENDTSGFVEDEINTLPAPSNLICIQQNVHTFELSWNDNSQFEQGFKIDRKIDEEEWVNEMGIVDPNITTWTDSTIGRNYEVVYYRVYVYYEDYSSTKIESNSNIVFPAPSNLTYQKLTISSIKLNWIDNSNGEDGFKIDKKVGENEWQLNYEITGENFEEWTDDNAEINETIQYRIYAYCGNNLSTSIETGEIDNTFPAPSNLQLEQLSLNEIRLSWQDNSNGEEGFKIARKVGNGDWVIDYGDVPANSEEWVDVNTIWGELHSYRIIAYYEDDFSASQVSSIDNIIEAPTNLTASVENEIDICLNWNDNSNIEEGFTIERKIEDSEYQFLANVNQNITTYIDVNVENLTTYYYRVYAYTQNHNSEYSNETSVTCYQGMLLVPDEYSTIQAAINSANYGDTVLVFPGNYLENINYNGNCVTVASLYMITNNPDYVSQTIIDGNQNGSVVTFESGEGSSAILTGFTVTNGNSDEGGGIYLNSSSPILKNLTIKNNNTSYYGGGGIYCNSYSIPHIENVILIGNSGYGLYCYTNSSPYLLNVTFTKNSHGICAYYDANPDLNNCILWDNGSSEISEYQDHDIDVYYSDIQGGWSGTGNIDSNPQFINPTLGNYHLSPGSPCIDAGNPYPQYNDPDGSRNDMGAYGGPGGDW